MDDISRGIEQYAKLRQASTKAAFENRFYTIQQGLIKNLNKEILKVNDSSLNRKVEEVQKQRNRLIETIPKLEEYQFNLQTNYGRFLEIQDDAVAALGLDGDANDALSAEEASLVNTVKESISYKIKVLVDANYPGIEDGNLVARMRQDALSLDDLTAVEGIIDAEDASSATNANRQIFDLFKDLGDRALNFSSSTQILVYSTNDMLINMQKAVYSKQADLSELTATELARKSREIDALKLQYSNMLQILSMSFEVGSGLGDLLAEGGLVQPEGGSILNLFT